MVDMILDSTEITWSTTGETSEHVDDSIKAYAVTIENKPHSNKEIPDVIVDHSRDKYLTPFGKATMRERYLIENESYQDRFANCVRYYANDKNHAQRLYDYISNLWCMPSTPILSNGGTTKGNLISCYVNEVEDSMEGIAKTWDENVFLSSKGGGIGVYYGNVRSKGERAGVNGKTSGAMSFMKVDDASVSCISQGMMRKGARAIYMDMMHPEIDAFLDMRKATGGDHDKKMLNLHHGVCIPDEFMNSVENDDIIQLKSPKDGTVMSEVRARDLWQKLLLRRVDSGEPYILFTDNVRKYTPIHHVKSGLYCKTSNLCSEITLPTGKDHKGIDRTAVCCLFQLNLEKWDEWKDNGQFILDVAYFLDNVLQDFIDNAGDEFRNARYSASRERSIGVGTMGFHSLLQSKNIPFESVIAKVLNKNIFKHIRKHMDAASVQLAEERGACPDAAEHGVMERFSYKMAQAPTASVSIICGTTSPSTDPILANSYTQKTLDGSFHVTNRYLHTVLQKYEKDTPDVWKSITKHKGSVQHLDFLTREEKDIFKTSFEIDQRWHLELSADRVPYICQAQSLNLFLPADIDKRDLQMLHMKAWKLGIKSLYYVRSYSIQRASVETETSDVSGDKFTLVDYDECLSCQ